MYINIYLFDEIYINQQIIRQMNHQNPLLKSLQQKYIFLIKILVPKYDNLCLIFLTEISEFS